MFELVEEHYLTDYKYHKSALFAAQSTLFIRLSAFPLLIKKVSLLPLTLQKNPQRLKNKLMNRIDMNDLGMAKTIPIKRSRIKANKYHLILSILLFSFTNHTKIANSCTTSGIPRNINDKIDAYVRKTLTDHGVPGAALAIIKDGKIVHQKNYGYANLEHEVLISKQSIFRLYSLSKPIVTVSVFKLIEQGKLDLEEEISLYLKDLPEAWNTIKIKHLLSYSSGLPDMGQPYLEVKDLTEEAIKARIYPLPLNFEKGERFEYSQTNFWFLQTILEKVSNSKLSEIVLNHQFPDRTESVFFSCDVRDIIKHRTTAYFPFLKGQLTIELPYYTGEYSLAASGLHLTLQDFMDWDRRFHQSQLISETSKQKMWASFPYSNSAEEFAYGWGKYATNIGDAYGFTGSGSTMYRTFPTKNISIIFLANGFTTHYDLGNMANQLAGMIH